MSKKTNSISKEQASVIEGIIIPVHWDEEGNSIAVALATSQEEEFLINMENAMGKKLLDFLQKKVKICGSLTTLDNNQKMMTIQKFIPIDYDEFVPLNNDAKMSI